jgi:hypothetical protein
VLCLEVRTLIKEMKKGGDISESDQSSGSTSLSGGLRVSTPQSMTGHHSRIISASTPGNSTEMPSADQVAKEQLVFCTQLIISML